MSRRSSAGILGACALALMIGLVAVGHAGTQLGAAASNTPAHSTPASSLPASTTQGPVADALEQAGLISEASGADAIDAASVTRMLDEIPVAPAGTMAGYSRTAFGPAWADTDHNGCDQRNDVLRRDMTDVTAKPGTHGCVVLTGHLDDPYTGKSIDFTRGEKTSTAVQVDHTVPEAWSFAHGAASWTAAQREQFATDLNELQATDGPTNESKGDDGPATWLPPSTAYRCTYVTRFTYIVHSYGLTIDQPDKTAIQQVLSTCR